MAGPILSFKGSEITADGGLFSVEVSEQLRRNLGEHVGELTRDGQKLVREGIKTKHGTGFTARNVEAYQDPRYRPSLYGKVRMDPDAVREPGSPRYPAKRRPFITAAVLETGRYGGGYVNVVRLSSRGARSRRKWQHSGSRRQAPLYMFRRAARVLKTRANAIRDQLLTRGL